MVGTADSLRATAYHEAAHAVVAQHVGVAFRSLSIAHGAPSLGCVVVDRMLPRLDRLELGFAAVEEVPGPQRRRIEAHVMVACAGLVAERIYGRGPSWHGPEHDLDRINRILDVATRSADERHHFLGWLEARTANLLHNELCAAEVVGVAHRLLEDGTLQRRDVTDAIAASVHRWERSRLRAGTSGAGPGPVRRPGSD